MAGGVLGGIGPSFAMGPASGIDVHAGRRAADPAAAAVSLMALGLLTPFAGGRVGGVVGMAFEEALERRSGLDEGDDDAWTSRE